MRSSKPLGALHSALAVYLPLCFLAAAVFLIANLIRPLAAFSVALAALALLLPGILSALGASFYFSLMKISKADHSAATLRGAVVVMLIAYPLGSLLRMGLPLPRRFAPGVINVIAPLCALIAWVQVLSLKRLFDARETLESYTEKHQGEKLQQLMLEDADLLTSLDLRIIKMRRIIFAQAFIVLALGILRTALSLPLAIAEFVLLILLFVNAACFAGLMEIFRQEHYYAGEGMAADPRDKSRRFTALILFSLAAALAALILSPGRGILPFSAIIAFFAWLASLFARNPGPAPEPVPMPEMPGFTPMQEMLPAELREMAASEPWPFWDWIKYGAIGLAALFFIYFMTKPLFERNRRGGPLLKRLGRLIAEWLKNLREAAALFFASLGRGGNRSVPLSPEALRQAADSLFAAYARQKKRELRGSLTLFARLILWGADTLNVSWHPAHGPAEYCRLLKAALLDRAADAASPAPAEDPRPLAVIRCGDLFEQALYGPRPLSSAEQREFKELVEEVTRAF
jgi:hypothetical protein